MSTLRIGQHIRRWSAAGVIAASMALLFTTRAAAQQVPKGSAAAESTLDARTRSVAAQLRCPVCQGLSLQDSPSELAQQMRDVVRQQLAEGKTETDVKNFFVARYGEWILMQPTAHGFNWLVYLLPVLALAAGGAVVMLAVRRWTSGADPSDESANASVQTPTSV